MNAHHVAVIISSLFGFFIAGGDASASWGYSNSDGPNTWPTNFAECGASEQSPINIVDGDASVMEWDDLTLTGFGTTPPTGATMTLSNNGHSAKVALSGNYMVSGGGLGADYKAVQFHFHWGDVNTVGSEHTLDGTQYAAEMHIVSYNTDYNNLTEALGDREGLAVIGFFIEVGGDTDNAAFTALTDALSNVTNKDDEYPFSTVFSIADMMPSTDVFYRYDGSLTTPECNEVVVWTVLKETVSISQAQIDALRSLKFEDGTAMGDNYRPTQPLGDRVVYVRDENRVGSATSVAISMATVATALISSFVLN